MSLWSAAAKLVGAEAVRLATDEEHRARRAETVSSAAAALRSATGRHRRHAGAADQPPEEPSPALLDPLIETLATLPTRQEVMRLVDGLQRDSALRSARMMRLIVVGLALNGITLLLAVALLIR